MSEGIAELESPEFKTWPFESFGQVLKISGSLGPEIFPYRVSLPKDSLFFRNVYDGVYKGRMATVFGSEKGKRPIANGVMVEHMAILAANDLGEVMISKEVFQGDFVKALTNYSQSKMTEYNQYTRVVRLPPGWRRFGDIHSHPLADALNSVVLPLGKEPEVSGLGVTWSGSDFESLIEPIKKGYKDDTVLGVITPIQIGLMVATKKTLEVLKRNDKEIAKLLKVTWLGLPPYKNFEKLGIVLYAGNHVGIGKNIILQRLIY
jgi:hypothetical protein